MYFTICSRMPWFGPTRFLIPMGQTWGNSMPAISGEFGATELSSFWGRRPIGFGGPGKKRDDASQAGRDFCRAVEIRRWPKLVKQMSEQAMQVGRGLIERGSEP